MLHFHKLDSYRYAVAFLDLASAIADDTPLRQRSLAADLRRSALALPVAIAGASGPATHEDRRQFRDLARTSALECAALVDALQGVRAVSFDDAQRAREVLTRVLAMVQRLALDGEEAQERRSA